MQKAYVLYNINNKMGGSFMKKITKLFLAFILGFAILFPVQVSNTIYYWYYSKIILKYIDYLHFYSILSKVKFK